MPAKIPASPEAEESVLGACLLNRQAVGVATEIIRPADFYKPAHANLFAAISDLFERGDPIDAVTVAGRATEMGLPIGDPSGFVSLMANVPSIANVRDYCVIVERTAVARNVMRAAQTALSEVTEGGDPFEVADELTKFTLGIGQKDVVQKAQTIQELAMSDAAVSKYVIPGLLAVDHRVIITARPGSGKSTFIKFMGLCAAQGIHPFKHSHMKPARVLSVDAENPGESILSTMIPLESTLMKYSDCFDEERFKIFRSPGGLNIRKRRQRTELQREIALHRPDIVVAGPIYKLNRRESGESYESAAEDFVDILDDLRTKYNFALILEAHPPKNSEEWTPMGSITLSNWAEVGMYLKKENPGDHHVTVGHFREDRLQGLGYPKSMDWSADWCFEGAF